MKKIIPITLICLLAGCSEGVLDMRSYNNHEKVIDIEKGFVEDLHDFEVTRNENKPIKNTKGLLKENYYHFKSKEPYKVDERGNWYHHWRLMIKTYDAYQSAVRNFNNDVREIQEFGAWELKGFNTKTIIADNSIYILRGDCREGSYVQEWFEKLLACLLQNQVI